MTCVLNKHPDTGSPTTKEAVRFTIPPPRLPKSKEITHTWPTSAYFQMTMWTRDPPKINGVYTSLYLTPLGYTYVYPVLEPVCVQNLL